MNPENLEEPTIDDTCIYLEDQYCCHPDIIVNSIQVSKGYCLKCSYRKVPIKEHAIKLLRELSKESSNAGFWLEATLPSDNPDIEMAVDQLAEKLKEVTKFLEAVGVVQVNNESV